MQALDQSFWARFARTTWEKKSVTIKNISSPLLELNHAEIFKMLVLYSDRCRRTKSADGVKFYIQGHRQFESEVLRHLPRKSDRSLEGYHQRMSSQYDDYCLVCDELLQVNHDKQDQLAELTSLLFANVGLPNRFAEMGLYLGNYRKTPFGVHEDACGVFSFPVAGKKKFRIWKPSYVRKNPQLVRAFSYAKYKSASQVLEAHAGDMTYWPSTAWHIAESDGSFSATWSLGVWVDKTHADVVTEITNAVFKPYVALANDAGMTNFSDVGAAKAQVESLPDSYLETLTKLKSLSPDAIESAFRDSWMAHLSTNGLKNSPSYELKLSGASVLQLRNLKRPIQWMRDGADIIYAFNGSVVRSGSKDLFKIIARLNAGAAVPAAKQIEILQTLATAGAFALRRSRK